MVSEFEYEALSVYTACETLGVFFFCACCLRERELFSYHIWSCGAKPIGSKRLMPYKHLNLAFSLLLFFLFFEELACRHWLIVVRSLDVHERTISNQHFKMHNMKASLHLKYISRSTAAEINGPGFNELMPVKIAHSKAETKTFFRHPEPMCLCFLCSVLCAGKRNLKLNDLANYIFFTYVNIYIYIYIFYI